MKEKATWQYQYSSSEKIEAPFANTSLLSNYLGQLIRDLYNQHFEQYINRNTFAIDNINLSPFHLLKCFDFNVEVFSDGEFYIHLLPVSKIVSASDITVEYLTRLKEENKNNSHTDIMEFSLVDCKTFKRIKINLLEKEFLDKSTEYIKNRKKVIATFDYHFAANYSPDIFGEITKHTLKNLKQSIEVLVPISELVKLPDFIELHSKPFSQINVDDLANKKNLLIGNGQKVKEQKAAYYNGIYKTVKDKVIQPVIIDGLKVDLLQELVAKFNQGGDIKVLEPITLSSNEPIDISIFKKLRKQFRQKLFLAILTKFTQPKDYFQPIYDLRIRLQLYHGEINAHKLSNYTVKCLEKLGGVLNIIDNTFEPETTYFVGIDLGHTTNNKEKFSNLCAVLFNNKGEHLAHKVIQKIPRNEAIDAKVDKKGKCEEGI